VYGGAQNVGKSTGCDLQETLIAAVFADHRSARIETPGTQAACSPINSDQTRKIEHLGAW
jgi:hypothetical protein